jgi:hypothetical protein
VSRRILVAALILAVVPRAAQAQRAQDDARLARLDARTRASVVRLADSLGGEGLPTEPLVVKALEGASKGADPARIEAAVRALAVALGQARGVLGPRASEAELVAGASALRAGARPGALARLRAARPGAPLTVPLATLSGLVARGVPADTASAAVVALAGRGASDAEFTGLERAVDQDVRAGVPAAAAAAVRARGNDVLDVLPGDARPRVPRGNRGDRPDRPDRPGRPQ